MQAVYTAPGVKLFHGDCRRILADMPDRLVQCCVTSPPYFGLRDYKHEAQIGAEQTPAAYVDQLVAVFRDVRRVLKDDGTLWLNLGSSYAGAGYSNHANTGGAQRSDGGKQRHTAAFRPGSGRADGIVDSRAQRNRNGLSAVVGYKAKDLIPIPWLVGIALQQDGWWLRQSIIWAKPNPMPESVTDRCTTSHEYILLLAKSQRYYYDADAIAEIADNAGKTIVLGDKSFARGQAAGKGVEPSGNGLRTEVVVAATRNKRSVWTVTPKPYSGAHFATFPPKLIEPCILAGSRPNDIVLDPFSGAGTTALVAVQHGRRAIGLELNADYIELTKQRFAETASE